MELPPAASNRTLLAIALIWLALLAPSFLLDAPAANWALSSGLAPAMKAKGHWPHWLAELVKSPGTYYITMLAAALVAFYHRLQWRAGVLVLLSGPVALFNSLVKWIFSRPRPFHTAADIKHGLRGLIDQGNMSFPSGHAATAFAAAATLAILMPRWRWLFFAIAVLVAAERVAETAHYVSDVVAAAGLATLGVHLLWPVWRQLLAPKPVLEVVAEQKHAR